MSIVKYNNNSVSDVTSGASLASGAMTHIKTLTASSSATLSFVHGTSDVVLDSTYPVYLFKWISCHPANNDTDFTVNFRDGGSNYDATKTTAYFSATINEADSTTFVKHFMARTNYSGHDEQSRDDFIAGYCNVTAAIDGVQFSFASGDIDVGTIKLYGIKDS